MFEMMFTCVFPADGGSVDQTDTDDVSRSSSRSSQLTAVVGGALQGLSPMIFMNNVVLKQVNFRPSAFAFVLMGPCDFSDEFQFNVLPRFNFLDGDFE